MSKMRTTAVLTAMMVLASFLPAFGQEVVTFGVIAPMTGNNIMVGDFIINGANLAQKHINEKGGILGKRLELVFEDEVDNVQTSVNAMTKMLNRPEISAFFGSTYSAYCIAVSPQILEKRIPMIAGGSSANIPKENNPYVWQNRMTDDNSGALLAKAAVEILNMKNPAFLHLADSFGTGLMEQTVAALKRMGVEVKPNLIFAHVPGEVQFGPLITQIANSDADGLIAISHQMPASIICMQVEAAGLDLPLLGSSSFGSVVARETAKDAADGWYAVSDWTPEVTTPAGRYFAQAYREEYQGKPDSDMPAVTAYDAIMLFAEACRIANTTTDREAINNAFSKIKAYPGAMSTYTPNEDRCFCTSQFLTYNDNRIATLREIVSVREP
ncbi:MAG: ABC transporter substrate-binding protein [Planctomycetes bacterium]|nr:ABC transporter substrate-binding protein [Planctomycetota bacterium]